MGFGKSFDEAFKPAMASSQSGTFDALKEKIKQNQLKAEEKYKATTLMHSNIAMAAQFGDEDLANKVASISEAAGNSVDAQKNIGEFLIKSLTEKQKLNQVESINSKILGSASGTNQPQTGAETSLEQRISGATQPAFTAQTGFKPVVTGISDSGVLKLESDSPKEQATRALQIRGEMTKDPIVKDFQNINTSVQQMDTLLQRAKSGDLKGKNALDQALISTFNKINDPQSVVRESEYSRTGEGIPFLNRLPGLLQKLSLGGAGLTDADRIDLVQAAKIIADVKGQSYNQQIGQYKELSKMFAVPEKTVLTGFSEHKPFLKPVKVIEVPSGVGTTSSGNTFRKK